MASNTRTFKGIVLSSEDYKDKDRIITFLTSDEGIVRVCAKGSVSSKSKSAFLSVPFMFCEVTVSDSHGYQYFKDGIIIENNSGIYNSLEAITVAGHISQVLRDSIHNSDNSAEAYELTLYAYYQLSRFPEKYSIICSAFNWRILKILGLNVEYLSCSLCGEVLNSNCSYNVSFYNGKIICSNCSRNDSGMILTSTAVKALNYFFNSDIKSLFTISATSELTRILQKFTFEYISAQFDKQYDSLNQIERSLLNNPVRRVES